VGAFPITITELEISHTLLTSANIATWFAGSGAVATETMFVCSLPSALPDALQRDPRQSSPYIH
jgi:hypothetical protein